MTDTVKGDTGPVKFYTNEEARALEVELKQTTRALFDSIHNGGITQQEKQAADRQRDEALASAAVERRRHEHALEQLEQRHALQLKSTIPLKRHRSIVGGAVIIGALSGTAVTIATFYIGAFLMGGYNG